MNNFVRMTAILSKMNDEWYSRTAIITKLDSFFYAEFLADITKLDLEPIKKLNAVIIVTSSMKNYEFSLIIPLGLGILLKNIHSTTCQQLCTNTSHMVQKSY